MVMTEQRELNLAPLCSGGPSVGSHTEQKMETVMCAVHLYVRLCACVRVCEMCFIDRCSDSASSSDLSEEEEAACSDL